MKTYKQKCRDMEAELHHLRNEVVRLESEMEEQESKFWLDAAKEKAGRTVAFDQALRAARPKMVMRTPRYCFTTGGYTLLPYSVMP